MHAFRLSLVPLSFVLAFSASAAVLNAAEIRRSLGVVQLSREAFRRPVRVAILDNGFEGFREGHRDVLPGTRFFAGPVNASAATAHGFGMAQILSAVVGDRRDLQLDLIDTNGFSNLKAAVEGLVERRTDVVLYSQNWEFGGNFDGGGFINRLVDRAVDAGALWINAAGNHHGLSFEGRVVSAGVGQALQLRAGAEGPWLAVDSFLDANALSITLSWSDFTDDETHRTFKDLDLEIVGPDGKAVDFPNRRQIGLDPSDADPLLSAHARETGRVELQRGRYFFRVIDRSGNFSATDRLRVVLTPRNPDAVRFRDATYAAEILAPADHARALTVGECGSISSVGPTRDGRAKPDVAVSDARVFFSDGQSSSGSSNAAAMLAGVVALLKGRDPALDGAKLLAWARELRNLSPRCGGEAPRWRLPSPVELERLR